MARALLLNPGHRTTPTARLSKRDSRSIKPLLSLVARLPPRSPLRPSASGRLTLSRSHSATLRTLVSSASASSKGSPSPAGLVFVDIKDQKHVFDELGHQVLKPLSPLRLLIKEAVEFPEDALELQHRMVLAVSSFRTSDSPFRMLLIKAFPRTPRPATG